MSAASSSIAALAAFRDARAAARPVRPRAARATATAIAPAPIDLLALTPSLLSLFCSDRASTRSNVASFV